MRECFLAADKNSNLGHLDEWGGRLRTIFGVVVKCAEQVEPLARFWWIVHHLVAQLLEGELGWHVNLDVAKAFTFFNHLSTNVFSRE